MNNSNLVTAGKRTQFKLGNTVSRDSGIKPWTLRKHLRWIGNQSVDAKIIWAVDASGNATFKLLTKELIKRSKRKGQKIDVTRLMAIYMIERLFKYMEPRLLEKIINAAEGKPKKSKQSMREMSDEEYIAMFLKDEKEYNS